MKLTADAEYTRYVHLVVFILREKEEKNRSCEFGQSGLIHSFAFVYNLLNIHILSLIHI